MISWAFSLPIGIAVASDIVGNEIKIETIYTVFF